MDILANVALLSRIQFALTVAYHFIFVPLSIGLGLITAIFATKYYRSRDEKDGAAVRRRASRWSSPLVRTGQITRAS